MIIDAESAILQQIYSIQLITNNLEQISMKQFNLNIWIIFDILLKNTFILLLLQVSLSGHI